MPFAEAMDMFHWTFMLESCWVMCFHYMLAKKKVRRMVSVFASDDWSFDVHLANFLPVFPGPDQESRSSRKVGRSMGRQFLRL